MVINTVLELYFWVVVASALLSWVRPDPYSPVVRFFYSITEPVFYRVRRLMPFLVMGGLDLTPVAVILIIQFLKAFLVRTFAQMGMVGI